jgi:phosphohistidine phosphatase
VKTLLLLRHAKSSWKNPDQADHDRPLNKRGRGDAPRIGRVVRDARLVPDVIISSTAARAVETAERVAETAGCADRIEHDGRVYHADPESIIEVVSQVCGDPGCVMVIGHNPGLELLLEALTDAEEELPTAAMARIEIEIDRWAELAAASTATLVQVWRPRELG